MYRVMLSGENEVQANGKPPDGGGQGNLNISFRDKVMGAKQPPP